MLLLCSMNDYSRWHCSVMEPGSAVAGHRGRNPLWPGGQSTTGQRTHHSTTRSYHFGSTEWACFLKITQPPRVFTQEQGEHTNSIFTFCHSEISEGTKNVFHEFFLKMKMKIKPWQILNLKETMFCKAQGPMQDVVVAFKWCSLWEPNFAVFGILQVSRWWVGIGGSLVCRECRVIHLS